MPADRGQLTCLETEEDKEPLPGQTTIFDLLEEHS